MRIAIFQPLIPHYRVPVFSLLGRQSGIDLTVYAGRDRAGFGNIEDHGDYCLRGADVREVSIGRIDVRIQSKQFTEIDPRRFDLVVVPWDLHYLNLGPSIWRARRKGIPIVLWGHGYSKRPRKITDWLRNVYGRYADAVLVYSQSVANMLTESAGFDSRRVFVARNAIDQCRVKQAKDLWKDRQQELAGFQERHGLDPTRTAIFVSRLEADNRIEMLLQTLREVRKECPNTKLIIVGDGPEKPRLESLAQNMGQAGHVIFTGAIYKEQELAPWMISAALFCYPVNIGLSLLHAFGYGLPVVTSDDTEGHNPEIDAFLDGINGLFYKDGSVDSMASRWLRIFREDGLRERLSREASRQVTEEFTLQKMVQGFLDITTLVDGKKRCVESPAYESS